MRFPAARIVLVAFALTIALAAAPAFAVESDVTSRGPVPNECSAFGNPLQGLSEAGARAAILASSTIPAFEKFTFTVLGKTFYFAPRAALQLNVERMLAAAYEPTTTVGFEIAPIYSVRSNIINGWVTRTARAADRAPVNAKYYLSSGKMAVYKGRLGQKLNQPAARTLIRSMVASVAASADVTRAPVPLRSVAVRPRTTVGNLGKILIVDVSDRRLRLYNNGRLQRKFRVAVGTASHPTPKGKWEIVRKVKNPSWTNPAPSGWGANMPAYIGPGPSNPLGTRALYLNASGIRVHGTSKRSSIGTAASHGCMRMLREDIEELYPLVPVGTTIYIVK